MDRFSGEVSDEIITNYTNKTVENEKIYNRTDNFKISNDLAKKIREYDSNYFIILISNYGWESYFSEELGITLENYGGFLIKEMLFKASARFGAFTKIRNIAEKEML